MKWKINRQINLSVIVQLLLLASLIVGTWFNVQRQLCLVQHDLERLLEQQKQFQHRLENLGENSLGHEYRLRAIEKRVSECKF